MTRTSESPGDAAPRGRPRSEAARRAVLSSALELCHRDGYQELTIKGIAEAAGVGRQTVYRWWPDKQSVLLEALYDLAAHTPALRPAVTSDDSWTDLERFLVATYDVTSRLTGPAVGGLMADAQGDAALAAELQEVLLGPRRQALRTLLERGVREGGMSEERVALDLAVDVVFGVMWYRLMSRHAPVDADLAAEITTVLRSLLGPT
jgi:AcrR family transcriptional regulator